MNTLRLELPKLYRDEDPIAIELINSKGAVVATLTNVGFSAPNSASLDILLNDKIAVYTLNYHNGIELHSDVAQAGTFALEVMKLNSAED